MLEGSEDILCCISLRDMDDTFEGRGTSDDAYDASVVSRKPLLKLDDCLSRGTGTGIVAGAALLLVRPTIALSSVSVSLLFDGKVSTASGLGLVCACCWKEVTDPASVRWR